MTSTSRERPRVAIVGGGLAGSAAAAALCDTQAQVTLFEARRQLGGRAASYRDPTSDELIDHCQHVSLGCCTNLDDLCRRAGLASEFRLDDTLYFFPPTGPMRTLRASRWLPAPLHLGPALLQLDYLSWRERLGIASALWRLARWRYNETVVEPTMLAWLHARGQSPRAIEFFWSPVLVSALGDTLDRVALSPARKVFVDGFMAARGAYRVRVPRRPLAELFGTRLAAWLGARGVELRCGMRVAQVACDQGRPAVTFADATRETFDAVIVAVPWRKAGTLFDAALASQLPWTAALADWPAAPITGVHLWFDRPLTNLPHAVILGRLSQWLFNRSDEETASESPATSEGATREYYHQVVISASQALAGRSKEDILAEVAADLRAVFPAAAAAQLLRGRVVTEPEAVFSTAPGCETLRPTQRTTAPGVFVAGDWTATGWPATMEGAVRSGYLAAEAVFDALGAPRRFLAPDLPRGLLARLLLPG
ncbi:MAG: hydroxysqualene dehydroxylase HpnE [Pirellulales bacterium]